MSGELTEPAPSLDIEIPTHDAIRAVDEIIAAAERTGATDIHVEPGFEVDMRWRDGALEEAEIHSLLGNETMVRYREQEVLCREPAGSSCQVRPQ